MSDLLTNLYVPGIISDVENLNLLSFTNTCNIYPTVEISNGRGGSTATFGDTITGVPCRLDVQANRLIPERSANGIEVQKIIKQIHIPDTYNILIDYQIETSAGSADGSLIRYRVLDVAIETDQTDISLLVEQVY